MKEFKLIITKNNFESNDPIFDINNILKGDVYKTVNAYFKDADGNIKYRNYKKSEEKASNRLLPRLAFQIFEDQIDALSDDEKHKFPITKYPNSDYERGIFDSEEDLRLARNSKSNRTLDYIRKNGEKYWILCNNLFSTLLFVQECLKRFGNDEDKFVLVYCEKEEKTKKDKEPINHVVADVEVQHSYKNEFSNVLINSKNIIFRGAPGTGKSYLAKAIAADIVSNGEKDGYDQLTDEEKKQIGFVQFHPSYDYSDFVEGLRPVEKNNIIGFELRDGTFKKFVDTARRNYENFKNKQEGLKDYIFIIDEINRGEISKIFGELFFSIDPGYRGEEGGVFTQYSNLHDDPNEKFFIPENVYIVGTMNDIDRSVDTFDFAMRRRFRFIEITAEKSMEMLDIKLEEDPCIKAKSKMRALNEAIDKTDYLNSNYHIGAAYFLKLNDLKNMPIEEKFDVLWTDFLQPLLQEYINGTPTEKADMEKFKKAYDKEEIIVGDEANETIENQ